MSSTTWVRRILSYGSAVGLLLVLAPIGLAGRDVRPPDGYLDITGGGTRLYTPPDDIRLPDEDHAGGSVRGCGDDIVAIAPRLHSVGQTASSNPTFVWYNTSEDNDPVEFQLYHVQPDGSPEVVTIQQFDTSQKGYSSYTLPDEEASLMVGETYIWQIVLYCDTAFANPGYYSSAELDVVDLPAEVATALTNEPLQRTDVYAGAGLWYDALAEVYDANTPAAEKLRQDLLIDLADLEAQSDKEDAIDISTQLRDIADSE